MQNLPPISENKKFKSGFNKKIVEKLNKNEPYATVFCLHYEDGQGNTVKMEIPVIFKNEFHYTCLDEDHFAECDEEFEEFVGEEYESDMLDPSHLEPDHDLVLKEGEKFKGIDLRNWIYTE